MNAKKPQAIEPIELKPDAWQRFELAVDQVIKSPPQHRAAKKAPPKKPRRKRQLKRPS
jgi:hypothetical protein